MVDPPPPRPTASPPPGWYHDGAGMRWWDGVAWGPAAPSGPNSDDRTLATLSHCGAIVGGFILPLVFYLIADDDKRPETRWHAREALNFQLSFLVVYLGAFIAFFVGLAAGGAFGASGSEAGAGIGFGIAILVFVVFVIGAVVVNLVWSIIGAVRANRGIRWEYPLRIPFIRA